MIILFYERRTMSSKSNNRVRITVLLDDETLCSLRDYMYRINGTTNVSKSIMLMVKEYEQNRKENSNRNRRKS